MKLLWRTQTGLPAPSYSATHRWLKWEVIKHLHYVFGDIPSFVEEEDLPPSRLKLQEILDDPPWKPFVKATYRLEGDGPLVLSTYEEIAALCVAILNQYYPNTNAVATKLLILIQSIRSQAATTQLWKGVCESSI